MLKRIINPSQALINFVLSLQLSFMQPQQSHLLRVVEALIVGTGRKTMAGMRREWYAAPDESAWSDFFRQSPWAAWTVQEAVAAFTFRDMLQRAEAAGAPAILFVSYDDSLTTKDKGTTALDGVDWHHDHTASGSGHYRNGMVHVSCRVQVGDYGYTFSWRLYLREKTVRRLNRQRPVDQRIAFRSKIHLAQEMLGELKPLVPQHYKVYVMFDSWYASAKLIKFIRRQGKRWHVLCAIKSNRKFNGTKLQHWPQQLRHKHSTTVTVDAANKERTYKVHQLQGRLQDIPFDVCVLISRRPHRGSPPKYFLCTDLTLSAQTILNWYYQRWSIEVDYWYLKQKLGLGDFRLHDYEAIQKWYAVVHLALTFLCRQLYEARDAGAPALTLADIIERHCADHAVEVLTTACQQAIQESALEPVLERFLNLPRAA